MKKMGLLLVFVAMSTFSFAQETIKMKVKENTVPCEGVAPMDCMQVKIGKDKEWQNFYNTIEGFTYEPGYEYRLKVVKTAREGNIPADASKYTYKLKKVVCKKKSKVNKNTSNATFNSATVLNKKMILTHINGKKVLEGKAYGTLNSESNMFYGKNGCNNFNSGFKLSGDKIVFSTGMGTLMACDPESMQLESDFSGALAQKEFTIQNKDNVVEFVNNKKEVVLSFEIPTEKDIWSFIDGKKWKLFMLDNTGKDYGKAFIQFNVQEKRVSGNAGCNNFFGSYTALSNEITFSGMGVTKMACLDDDKMETEGKVLNYLSEQKMIFDVADQTLNFYKDDRLVMVFGLSTE